VSRIAVIGGTGYAGSHIVAEAVRRGHTVVSVARSVPAERLEGATYIEGTVLDVPGLTAELEGVDVVVSAVAPRGDMLGKLRPAIAQLASVLPESVRLGVVGGAGGSLVAAAPASSTPRASPTSTSPRRPRPSASWKTFERARPIGTGSTSTRPADSAYGHRASAPEPTATADTSSSSTRRATPSSPAPTSPSPCSTRSRTRSTRATTSPSGTDAANDDGAVPSGRRRRPVVRPGRANR